MTYRERVEEIRLDLMGDVRCRGYIASAHHDAREAAAAIAAEADAEIARLRAALTEITNRYCDLANSGDCGFWDPEDEDEVKQARAALSPGAGEGGE